jgi:hypothetical protein
MLDQITTLIFTIEIKRKYLSQMRILVLKLRGGRRI